MKGAAPASLKPDLRHGVLARTRLAPSYPRQDAPHFLGRNREPRRHARYFTAFALPDPCDHNLRKFFADLPERLLAHRALRPRLQRRMDTCLAKNFRTQGLQILPHVVVGLIRPAGC